MRRAHVAINSNAASTHSRAVCNVPTKTCNDKSTLTAQRGRGTTRHARTFMSTARRHDLAVDAAAPRPVITASRDERNVVSSSMTSRVIQPNIAAIISVRVSVEHDHLANVRRNLHSPHQLKEYQYSHGSWRSNMHRADLKSESTRARLNLG